MQQVLDPAGFPMTTVPSFVGSADPQVVVVAELLGAAVEAVVTSPDPCSRASVICSLVEEMCAALGWLHEPETPLDDATNQEVASIGQLAAAAHGHHLRMSSLHTRGSS